ncbi:MAG: zinc ribbon domain-containing protein [Oscillochloris sp.]|nr:zinc ribbon domain-containing protein [Oscillochloris sp.]
MVERICPACNHPNPLENRFCGACGAGLETMALAKRSEATITIAGREVPIAQLKQVGKTVALGVAALAAEAGMAWLRQRTKQINLPATLNPQRPAPLTPGDQSLINPTVTIVSQRVVEIWERGDLTRQIVEKHVWRKEN